MKLTIEEIEHLARLANLGLAAEEKELYREQISSVLEYVAKLGEVDTSGVEPTAQVTGLVNVSRDDVVHGSDPGTRELLLKNMPERNGDLLKVPAIL